MLKLPSGPDLAGGLPVGDFSDREWHSCYAVDKLFYYRDPNNVGHLLLIHINLSPKKICKSQTEIQLLRPQGPKPGVSNVILCCGQFPQHFFPQRTECSFIHFIVADTRSHFYFCICFSSLSGICYLVDFLLLSVAFLVFSSFNTASTIPNQLTLLLFIFSSAFRLPLSLPCWTLIFFYKFCTSLYDAMEGDTCLKRVVATGNQQGKMLLKFRIVYINIKLGAPMNKTAFHSECSVALFHVKETCIL